MSSEMTNLQRDYLAEIFQLGDISENGYSSFVASADLADRLFSSQSSVNRTIERLRDARLIRHERYIGVQLTELGRQEALKVLRKQAIIETFLVRVMGFGWHEVYEEAQRMRHHVDGKVLDRMWEIAGRPARSPFGEWIKDRPPAGDVETQLAKAATEQDYVINRVLTRQQDRLEYLASLKLTPGCRLHLLHKAPFNGPIQIQLQHEYRIIGHELAKTILVVPPEIVDGSDF